MLTSKKWNPSWASALSLLVMLGTPAWAEEPEVEINPVDESAANPWRPKVTLELGRLNEAGIKDYDGGVSDRYYDALIENGYGYLGYTQWNLDWHDVSDLPFGDGDSQPIKGLQGVRLGGKFNHRFNDKTMLLSSLGVSSKYEAQTDDSYSVNLRALIAYRLQKDISVLGGVIYNYHPVRSRIYPAIGLGYRARAEDGISAVLGFPRAFVAYGFAQNWKISSGISYRQFMARLAKDNSVEAGGYVELQTWKADVMLSYDLTRDWQLDVMANYSADYRFTFYNEDGNRQNQYQLEPSWGGGLRMEYQF
ncbi:MAG: hypothetical protein ACP5D0_02710 [Hydrogenovibrio sp.]